MRYFVSILLLLCTGTCLLYSCEKWVDPPPKTDPRLTNLYCNDPNAVNYNWGFPGKPDNTICFYPNQLFAGVFTYYDSIYIYSGPNAGTFVFSDSVILTIHTISDSVISVFGWCASPADSIILKAGPTYIATVDTVVGDSITTEGQLLCRAQDTLAGISTITRDRIDSPAILHINFIVVSDTGSTQHMGSARIHP